MRVDVDRSGGIERVHVALSRRNLTSLLAKLDGNPPNSMRTLYAPNPLGDPLCVSVGAEEDEEQYHDRAPGQLHPDTLRAMAGE